MANIAITHMSVFLTLVEFQEQAGIYRWSIILADTDFFQQSVSAANFRGRLICEVLL